MPIKLKLNLSKIDKKRIFKGKNGLYLDVVCIESTNDKYGNDWMVIEEVTKEEREKGVRGTIIGGGKNFGKAVSGSSQRRDEPPQQSSAPNFDDMPF